MWIGTTARLASSACSRRLLLFFALTIALVGTLWPAGARAGAWLLEEGAWTLIVPVAREASGDFRNADGEVYRGPVFTKWQVKPVLEGGLRSWLTVGVSPDWQHMSQHAPASATLNAQGLAAVDLYARLPLHRTDHTILSVQALALIPGTFDAAVPFAAVYGTPTVATRPGGEARLLLGRGGFGPRSRAFVDAQAAYRRHGGPAQDELRLDVTTGWGDPAAVLALLQFFGTWSRNDAEAPAVNHDLMKIRAGAVLGFAPGAAVQVAVEHAVAGRNTIAGSSFTLALWRWW